MRHKDYPMLKCRASLAYVLPVFLGVVFLGSEVLSSLFREQARVQSLQVQVAEIDVIGDLVHELQRERGYSSGVLASRGTRLLADLEAQRLRTDAALMTLRQTWGFTDLPTAQSDVLRDLLSVRELRRLTDARAVTHSEIVAQYSRVVADLLATGIVIPHTVNAQVRLNMLTSALQAVSMAKDAAGRQRASGAGILARPDAQDAPYGAFNVNGAQELAFLDLAAIHLRSIQDMEFHSIFAEPAALVAAREQIAALQDAPGATSNVTPEVWFTTATAWIDQLRTVERDLQSRINDHAQNLQQETQSQLVFNGMAVGFALLLLTLQLLFPQTARRSDEGDWDPSVESGH